MPDSELQEVLVTGTAIGVLLYALSRRGSAQDGNGDGGDGGDGGTQPECTADADCPSGMVCENGECVEAEPEPECTADADCPAGMVCQNGECVEDLDDAIGQTQLLVVDSGPDGAPEGSYTFDVVGGQIEAGPESELDDNDSLSRDGRVFTVEGIVGGGYTDDWNVEVGAEIQNWSTTMDQAVVYLNGVEVLPEDFPVVVGEFPPDGGGDGGGTPGTVDIVEPFDSSSWIDTFGDVWDYGYGSNTSIVNDSQRGNVMEMMVPGGENRGVYTVHNHAERAPGGAPERMYHRYRLKVMPGFTDNWRDDGKLPGFAGRNGTDEGAGGTPAQGTGWSARGGWADPGDFDRPGIVPEFYCYHMDAGGSYGDHLSWDTSFVEGQWYDVEQYIDLGTPDTNDGILRAWVDGSLVYERTDLRFRESGGNDVSWSWLDFYHGGGTPAGGDIKLRIDDFEINRGGMP